MTDVFELCFWGGIPERDERLIRPAVKREHKTLEAARKEAIRVLKQIDRRAHPAIIYGPGIGKNGLTID